jgi:hypothetical protein
MLSGNGVGNSLATSQRDRACDAQKPGNSHWIDGGPVACIPSGYNGYDSTGYGYNQPAYNGSSYNTPIYAPYSRTPFSYGAGYNGYRY